VASLGGIARRLGGTRWRNSPTDNTEPWDGGNFWLWE